MLISQLKSEEKRVDPELSDKRCGSAMRRGPKAMRLISYRCHFTRSPGIQRSSSCIYAQLIAIVRNLKSTMNDSRMLKRWKVIIIVAIHKLFDPLAVSWQLHIDDFRFSDIGQTENDNSSGFSGQFINVLYLGF
ncbi:hypothetical protein RHGRI_008378 [Rhododendron griersonianum]|uniref:Uncharacterized protein n=1 Tax=Rhododendron griersonianum TaxID=479676 RepID=A0AAV6L113_9ERIC|nr:hypothetical protein RHGRI_008378 [Rhododendron griersonianum]